MVIHRVLYWVLGNKCHSNCTVQSVRWQYSAGCILPFLAHEPSLPGRATLRHILVDRCGSPARLAAPQDHVHTGRCCCRSDSARQPHEDRFKMLLKSLVIGLLIAIGEVVNGNIRVRVLHKIFGKKQAKTISFLSGTIIIFTICWFTLSWIDPKNYIDCLKIGFIWFLIMLCLDIYFAKYVFKMKWGKIVDDFNVMKGNLLGVGMVLLIFSPVIIFKFQ